MVRQVSENRNKALRLYVYVKVGLLCSRHTVGIHVCVMCVCAAHRAVCVSSSHCVRVRVLRVTICLCVSARMPRCCVIIIHRLMYVQLCMFDAFLILISSSMRSWCGNLRVYMYARPRW